jgi:hypothetical protein
MNASIFDKTIREEIFIEEFDQGTHAPILKVSRNAVPVIDHYGSPISITYYLTESGSACTFSL